MIVLAAVGLVTAVAFACSAVLGRGCNIAAAVYEWLCDQAAHVVRSFGTVEFFVHVLDQSAVECTSDDADWMMS